MQAAWAQDFPAKSAASPPDSEFGFDLLRFMREYKCVTGDGLQ